jgi:hypothetical protein
MESTQILYILLTVRKANFYYGLRRSCHLPLPQMAKFSSTPPASIRGLVTTFVTLIGTVSAAPTLTATLGYGISGCVFIGL